MNYGTNTARVSAGMVFRKAVWDASWGLPFGRLVPAETFLEHQGDVLTSCFEMGGIFRSGG